MTTKADEFINKALQNLGLGDASNLEVYGKINEIVAELQTMNKAQTISAGTTGTITERLCQRGLQAACPDSWKKMSGEWKWLGDFYILGAPFNTIITVKSFKAKERLLSSGTGNLLSPTIGYGFFDDPTEWSPSRLISYIFRAFFVIYMPWQLLSQLSADAKDMLNINRRPFLRNIESLIPDIQGAMSEGKLDPRKL